MDAMCSGCRVLSWYTSGATSAAHAGVFTVCLHGVSSRCVLTSSVWAPSDREVLGQRVQPTCGWTKTFVDRSVSFYSPMGDAVEPPLTPYRVPSPRDEEGGGEAAHTAKDGVIEAGDSMASSTVHRGSFAQPSRTSSRVSVRRRGRSSFRDRDSYRNETLILFAISFLTVGGIVASFLSVPPDTPKQILGWLKDNPLVGMPIVTGILIVSIPLFLPVSKLIYLSLGYLYGFWLGWFAAMVAVLLGYILTFGIGRYGCHCLGDYVQEKARRRLPSNYHRAILTMIKKDGIYTTFVVRFLPLPSNLMCYMLATTNVRFSHYVAGSMMKAPIASTPVYVYLGTSVFHDIDEIAIDGASAVSNWVSLGFSFVFLVLFMVLFYFVRKRFQKDFLRRVASSNGNFQIELTEVRRTQAMAAVDNGVEQSNSIELGDSSTRTAMV